VSKWTKLDATNGIMKLCVRLKTYTFIIVFHCLFHYHSSSKLWETGGRPSFHWTSETTIYKPMPQIQMSNFYHHMYFSTCRVLHLTEQWCLVPGNSCTSTCPINLSQTSRWSCLSSRMFICCLLNNYISSSDYRPSNKSITEQQISKDGGGAVTYELR